MQLGSSALIKFIKCKSDRVFSTSNGLRTVLTQMTVKVSALVKVKLDEAFNELSSNNVDGKYIMIIRALTEAIDTNGRMPAKS